MLSIRTLDGSADMTARRFHDLKQDFQVAGGIGRFKRMVGILDHSQADTGAIAAFDDPSRFHPGVGGAGKRDARLRLAFKRLLDRRIVHAAAFEPVPARVRARDRRADALGNEQRFIVRLPVRRLKGRLRLLKQRADRGAKAGRISAKPRL